jgi:alcohol dehydrogenase class IV
MWRVAQEGQIAGRDEESRAQMMVASIAAVAAAQKGLGVAHSTKHSYTSDFIALASEAGAPYFACLADHLENYERVRSMLDRRYQEWREEEE